MFQVFYYASACAHAAACYDYGRAFDVEQLFMIPVFFY
jgi:hypothetical protein